MFLSRRVGAVIFVVLALGGAIAGVGLLEMPTAGVESMGQWGTVTDERTEVTSTVWVDNPNPVGVPMEESVVLSHKMDMNGITVASGKTQRMDIDPGRNTLTVSSDIQNERLDRWWVAFLEANETLSVRIEPRAEVHGILSPTLGLPAQEQTMVTDSTPISTALSRSASRLEGSYTKDISVDSRFDDLLDSDLFDGISAGSDDDEVTVGYEIRRGWASWGNVTEDTTVVHLHVLLHNPSERIPLSAKPDNIGAEVTMNDIEMLRATDEDARLLNPGDFETSDAISGRVLMPGETTEAVYALEMDNDHVDEWFQRHVRRGEQTTIRTEMKLRFGVDSLQVEVPRVTPMAYECDLQTGMFVEGQTTRTTCERVD